MVIEINIKPRNTLNTLNFFCVNSKFIALNKPYLPLILFKNKVICGEMKGEELIKKGDVR